MATVNLIMILVGAAILIFSIWRARGPYLRSQDLRAHLANLDRYESWRGNRPDPADRGPDSGALMIAELRRQVRLWLGVGGVGLLLVLLGFWLD